MVSFNENTLKKARQHLIMSIEKKDVATLKKILDAGFPINEPVTRTPFMSCSMYAAARGDKNIFNIVMGYEPDVELTDATGRNLMHLAARAGQVDILQTIFEDSRFQALHESRTLGGLTPLMFAVQSGSMHAVGECLNQGLNPFSPDRLGLSALEHAAPFTNINGQSMPELIEQARDQWRAQVPPETIQQQSTLPDGMTFFKGFSNPNTTAGGDGSTGGVGDQSM